MYWKKEITISFCIITISASNLYMPMIRLYVFLLDFLIPFLCDPDLQCVSAFQPLVTLKEVPKAACDPEKLFQKLLARMYIGEIQPMRAKARWVRCGSDSSAPASLRTTIIWSFRLTYSFISGCFVKPIWRYFVDLHAARCDIYVVPSFS